ncbi:MAG: AMP-binding protein [Bacteroidetes bacterium]|nr:AMP-binding protein [Bacteroidota bacterium]
MPQKSAYYQPELTLPDLLNRTILINPELFIGYSDKNSNLTVQTYKELLDEAKLIAAGFFNLGLKQGDKIIIATRYCRETIEILWGSFLLGLVPTILQAPATFSGDNPPLVKLLKVFELLNSPYVFVSAEVKDTCVQLEGKIKHRDELVITGTFPEPNLTPDDLAFVQFSSGSTGDPKGIMLTHGNLMVNLDAITVGLDLGDHDKFGNWMPLFHDMGLIGYHLTPIYCSISQCHLETLDFIMNPGLWLNLMSRQKVTISGTTNFGLALVLKYLKRGKQIFEWDFTSMKALLNGAEPISVKIMQEFVDALVPSSLRPEVMMPVYGMAESTLAISFASLRNRSVATAFNASLLDREHKAQPVDASDPSARLLSEVGVALNDIEIRITDDHDRMVKEGFSGHIQIKGPSVTKGYYNNPGATASTFCGEWLRTGDIGFFFEGNLYISGRYKDIIFKNGIHYFANDLEELACTIDEIKYGKICLGGTTGRETGDECVIAFVAGLPEEKAPETFRELRMLLRSNLGISIDVLVLIKSNEIPKTSSGKLQRYKLMQRYLTGDFDDRILLPDKQDYL